MSEPFDYDDNELEHGLDCDCEECDLAYHERTCGLLPDHLGGGCTMSGTEYCDFDCPFRDLGEDDG